MKTIEVLLAQMVKYGIDRRKYLHFYDFNNLLDIYLLIQHLMRAGHDASFKRKPNIRSSSYIGVLSIKL